MNQSLIKKVVRKSITVSLAPAEAFRLWTELIHTWWPNTHSISGDPHTRVCIEGRVGGRFFERASNEEEFDWGVIEVWRPPRRLAFTWFLGSRPQLPTRVEVRFVPVNNSRTRVEVEHRGPELIGDLWRERVKLFEGGWEAVLGRYAERIDEN